METPLFPCNIFENDFKDVYEPSEDTFVLMDAIQCDLQLITDKVKPLICMEIGTGSGAVITSLAKTLGPNKCLYIATDINPKAALTANKCCSVNNVEGMVQLVVTDLANAIQYRLRQCVDLLIFNPPYVPTEPGEVGGQEITSSWAGGLRGRHVIDRFLTTTVPLLLSPNGVLYLIVIKQNNINEIRAVMSDIGFTMTIVIERKCGLENLMALRFNRVENDLFTTLRKRDFSNRATLYY